MSLFQSCLGIDLRKDGVVLSLLRKSLSQVLITASGSFTFSEEKGKEEREAEIISTIQGFLSSQHLSKDNVIVALPREKALMKIVEMPSAARENLRTVLEYELGKHIPSLRMRFSLISRFSKNETGYFGFSWSRCERRRSTSTSNSSTGSVSGPWRLKSPPQPLPIYFTTIILRPVRGNRFDRH